MSTSIDITPRFRRSVRIDTDFSSATAIDGFYCPPSFAAALSFMARHVADTGQGAFTWTGPYGGGKSSLALAFACLVGAKKPVREQAIKAFGPAPVQDLKDALPYFPSRWDVLPLVTEKRAIVDQLADALGVVAGGKTKSLSQVVLKELSKRSSERGFVLILDELGRALEAAAEGEGDVHLLQDIAELASRSEGRFLFIGILHQSFEEYAERLGREARDTWAKIQGRFVDISISVSLDETIDLIGQAIECKAAPQGLKKLSSGCVETLRPQKSKSEARRVAESLIGCAPLHPLAACLLGPLSRRRFGQNQRSVFSFLASSERFGLQDVMSQDEAPALYPVFHLWDYVRANLESAVLASPDSRRWVVAVDALERCAARGGNELEIQVLKTVGMIELLKDRSGLVSSAETIKAALHIYPEKEIDAALRSVERASEIVFRKHAGAYVLYAGSDFDIDAGIASAMEETPSVDLSLVRSLADLQPMLAKRHHRETGAMRWFDIAIEPLTGLGDTDRLQPRGDAVGHLILAIPTQGESLPKARSIIKKAVETAKDRLFLVGYNSHGENILDYAKELSALLALERNHPELRGDTIARREIDGRAGDLRSRMERELAELFDAAEWSWAGQAKKQLSKRALSEVLSEIVDEQYKKSPRLQNELLNCSAPSSNAVSGRTKLMKRMVLNTSDEDLNFSGKLYPAERGIFESLLKQTGLHGGKDGGAVFSEPKKDAYNLIPLWKCADRLLSKKKTGFVTAQTIIDAWCAPPIGLKAGLGPVFIIAYALSRRESVAVYGEGVFQSRFNELGVEFLARNPSDVALRHVEMEGITQNILSELGVLLELPDHDEPLSVARAIVGQFDALVPWISRTQSLKPKTLRVREILKRANDPNKLLFDDFPALVDGNERARFDAHKIALIVRDALADMRSAYPKTLAELKALMLNELDVRAETDEAIVELRARADNILQISGDLRMDGFIGRVAQFHGTEEDMEGLAGLAAGKLPRDWNDADKEKAAVEIVTIAQEFLHLETLARVKGRKDKRHALAVVVGKERSPSPLFREFEVSDSDRNDITALARAVDKALSNADFGRREIILAALVEVTSKYLEEADAEDLKARASA